MLDKMFFRACALVVGAAAPVLEKIERCQKRKEEKEKKKQ
jgi:hypothetical protein